MNRFNLRHRALPHADQRTPLWFALFGLIAVLSLATAQTHSALAREPSLAAVMADVRASYDGVEHITAADLIQLLKREPDTLLIDVRETEEYAVSHLEGAQHLDPGAWVWTFEQKFADKLKGRTVVFYCSVGVRSSRMAEHVNAAAEKAGAKRVYNLVGGIFDWHNQKLPLTNAAGATDLVHPYDTHWGRLLTRPDQARMRLDAVEKE